MKDLPLQALDGTNPLAWLAALGTLIALRTTAEPNGPPPRLRWEYRGRWIPCLSTSLSHDQLIDLLVQDRDLLVKDPAFTSLQYEKRVKKGVVLQRDLKAPTGVFRDYFSQLTRTAPRTSLDLAAAFATDVAVDGNGNTKPTALHFTAAQQQFLDIADKLAKHIGPDEFEEALFRGWTYTHPATEFPTFSWDSSTYRLYALRADDPSGAFKGTVPGADWLAFRGLVCLPCVPRRNTIVTTLCTGSGNRMQMHWPLWGPSLTEWEVRSLLVLTELRTLSAYERSARGITMVLESAILRSEQGYGAFAPAQPIQPRPADQHGVCPAPSRPIDESSQAIHSRVEPKSPHTEADPVQNEIPAAPTSHFWDFDDDT